MLKEKSKEFFDFLNNINVYLWLDDYYNDALLRTKVKMFAVDPIIDRNELAPFNNCGIDLINKHEYTNQEMYNRCTLDQACLFIQMKSGGILYKCLQEAYNNYLEDYFDLKFPKDYVKLSLDIYNTNQVEVLDFINTGSNFCEYCNRIFDNHTEDSISQSRLSRRELSEWVKNY